MNRKQVKKLMKEHPSFTAWVRQDPRRVDAIRANPAEADRYYRQWKAHNAWIQDLQHLSEKAKRASELLDNIRTAIDMMTELQKKGDRKSG